MKKLIIFLLLAGILAFIFYLNKEAPKILTSEVTKVPAKLVREEPIVKKRSVKKPVLLLPEEKRGVLNKKIVQRMEECNRNDFLFKNKKINTQNLNKDIEDLFKKALGATKAGELYKQYIADLESKPTYNLVSYDRKMNSLDICKGLFALEFLDKIIDSKNFDVSILLRNLNEKLLANHFSRYNLALIFGKISRIISYGLINKEDGREILELRDRFEKIEQEFTFNVQHLENDDLAQDLFVNYYHSLEEIGISLKQALEKVSSY